MKRERPPRQPVPTAPTGPAVGTGWTVPLAALGGLGFFLVVFGPTILDPRYIAWLLADDPVGHYLGFEFFRRDPWTFPVGLIPSFGAPGGSSIVYTDSIPLLAIPFKTLSGWLPEHFQYFGAWLALCYVLTGVFAARILLRLGLAPGPALAGAMLLLTFPAMAMRMYGHEALVAHWLVLAAFDMLLAGASASFWGLLVVASLVHAYWLPMIFPIAIAAWWKRPVPIPRHAAGLGLLAFVMTAAGYFALPAAKAGLVGFGYFNANLLTFVDPMSWTEHLKIFRNPTRSSAEWSRLLPAVGYPWGGQYEGFAYLGAGMLLAVVVAAVLRFRSLRGPGAQPLRVLLGVSALLFAWALAGRVAVGPHGLVDIRQPGFLDPLTGVFRSTGRFGWPLAWILSIIAIREVGGRFRPSRGLLLLAALFVLQAWDLGAKWGEFGRRFSAGGLGGVPDFSGPGWVAAAPASRIVVLPSQATNDDWVKPAVFAVRHGQSTNYVLLARWDEKARELSEAAERKALLSGSPRRDTAYLIRDPALAGAIPEIPGFRRIEQDGFLFFVAIR